MVTKKQRFFLRNLANSGVRSCPEKRFTSENQRMPKRSREASELLGFIQLNMEEGHIAGATSATDRCKVCGKVCRR